MTLNYERDADSCNNIAHCQDDTDVASFGDTSPVLSTKPQIASHKNLQILNLTKLSHLSLLMDGRSVVCTVMAIFFFVMVG